MVFCKGNHFVSRIPRTRNIPTFLERIMRITLWSPKQPKKDGNEKSHKKFSLFHYRGTIEVKTLQQTGEFVISVFFVTVLIMCFVWILAVEFKNGTAKGWVCFLVPSGFVPISLHCLSVNMFLMNENFIFVCFSLKLWYLWLMTQEICFIYLV